MMTTTIYHNLFFSKFKIQIYILYFKQRPHVTLLFIIKFIPKKNRKNTSRIQKKSRQLPTAETTKKQRKRPKNKENSSHIYFKIAMIQKKPNSNPNHYYLLKIDI